MIPENELFDIAIQICDEYDLPYPNEVRYNSRIRSVYGRCYPNSRIIELSGPFCRINSDEVAIALIKHECSHLKYPDHKKDFVALQNKMSLGTRVQDTFKVNNPYTWQYTCLNCGYTYKTIKKEHKKYGCGKCKTDNKVFGFKEIKIEM